jgi:Na+-driven multidrug efflux pump
MAAASMLVLAVVVEVAAGAMIQVFSPDPRVIAFGKEYLEIIAWNFVASGVIFVTSSMFQALGNTVPSFIASFARLVLVAVPALVLARVPSFTLRWVWYLSVGSVAVQMLVSLVFLRREFRARLNFEPVQPA